VPAVHSRDAFTQMKQDGNAYVRPDRYGDIHMPKDTGAGFLIGLLAFAFGFAMIWHIWWLAGASALGIGATVMARASRDENEYTVSADEVARIENQRYRQLASTSVVSTEEDDDRQVAAGA